MQPLTRRHGPFADPLLGVWRQLRALLRPELLWSAPLVIGPLPLVLPPRLTRDPWAAPRGKKTEEMRGNRTSRRRLPSPPRQAVETRPLWRRSSRPGRGPPDGRRAIASARLAARLPGMLSPSTSQLLPMACRVGPAPPALVPNRRVQLESQRRWPERLGCGTPPTSLGPVRDRMRST